MRFLKFTALDSYRENGFDVILNIKCIKGLIGCTVCTDLDSFPVSRDTMIKIVEVLSDYAGSRISYNPTPFPSDTPTPVSLHHVMDDPSDS